MDNILKKVNINNTCKMLLNVTVLYRNNKSYKQTYKKHRYSFNIIAMKAIKGDLIYLLVTFSFITGTL